MSPSPARMRPRVTGIRNEESVARMRDDVESLLLRAEQARIVTAGTSTEFWEKYMRPALYNQVESFTDKDSVLGMDPERFEVSQKVAQTFNFLLEFTEGLIGKEEEFKEKAKEIQMAIQEAENEGLVEKKLESE